MWSAYALSQFPSGVLGDRFGERRVILVSVGGTVLAALLLAASPLLAVFVGCTVLLGGFAGLHYSVATTLLERIYDDVGTAIGIHNNGAVIAGLIAPVGVAWVAVRAGWRVALATTALVGFPVFVLFFRFVRPTEPRRPDQPMRERFEPAPIAELLSRPPILFTLFVATLGAFTWQGVASFLPTFLVERHGYSTTRAGTLFSVYFVVQGVGQVGVGRASDRLGRDRLIFGCMLAGVAGLVLLVTGPTLAALLAGAVLLGVGMSWGAAVLPRFLSRFDEAERGAGIGLVRTVYLLIASLGSVAVGAAADLFGWGGAFGLLAGLLTLVACALVANEALKLGL